MKKDVTFLEFVTLDLFGGLSNVTSRPMMSGWGLYSSGIIFAAIIGNVLYFKAKGELATRLGAAGFDQFSYQKKSGHTIWLGYWRVPDELLDDREQIETWASEAIVALAA